MRLMVTNSAPVRVLSLVDDQIRARIVECNGHIILSADFKGLRTNLPRAVVDSGFKSFRLGFERFRLLTRLLALMPAYEPPRGESR
jgi:hypothetical protein